MSEVISKLEIDCLSIGIKVDEFWTLDFDDIRKYFKAFEQREKARVKEEASMIYRQSALTSEFISLMFGNKKVPQLDDAFPGLFDEEMAESRLNRFATQFTQYALNFNKSRRKDDG